jgi:putative FmdB family regulatory protein
VPTYEYACTTCGHRLEAVQSFTDDPLTECPECGGALRKVYGNVGIVLKGSGFYKTDSRAAASAANGSGGKGTEKSGGDSSGTDSSGKDSSGKDSSGKDSAPKKEGAAASKDSGAGAKPAATAAN